MNTDHAIDQLIHLLEKGDFFKPDFCKTLKVDLALDERDSDPFDTCWVSAFNEVNAKFLAVKANSSVAEKVNKVRELAFKAIAVLSLGELAEYVCDDFELIAKALLVESKNSLVAALLEVYASGKFPYGDLALSNCDVNDVMKKVVGR